MKREQLNHYLLKYKKMGGTIKNLPSESIPIRFIQCTQSLLGTMKPRMIWREDWAGLGKIPDNPNLE